jgi:hypothetical protein
LETEAAGNLGKKVYSGTGHGFSTPKEQGGGALQRAVDHLHHANAQGDFQHLSAASGLRSDRSIASKANTKASRLIGAFRLGQQGVATATARAALADSFHRTMSIPVLCV